MRRISRHFLRNRGGAVGAEFALVVPLAALFILGIIDAGRLMWSWNRAEKATQMGVRYAVTTDMIPDGLLTYDFLSEGIPRGDPITEADFGGATCTSTGCTCNAGATCPPLGTWDTASTTDVDSEDRFRALVTRMQDYYPEIRAQNVVVEYGYSGLGYSGDPYGADMDPLVTVRLTGMSFEPSVGFLFGGSLGMPAFAATLTMEDGEGPLAN
jgi:Flp pilus assembly pilin Flp